MSFTTLAVISLAALLGPLLALPERWHLPVVLGELAAGIVLGPSVVGYLDAGNSTFTFLADIGFALIMFVAGARVPLRDASLRAGLRTGVLRAAAVGLLAVGPAFAAARLFHTGHTALYAVLMASSSAALVLPIVDSLSLGGPPVLQLLPQVAVADTVCIVALPLVIDPRHAARAAFGALAVIGCAAVAFVVLRRLERDGYRRRLHRLSQERRFALELRISLVVLFALAALAVRTHVSIMLAGFSFGLVVAAIGEPRRLARQLFALSEGFLGPLFFLWLGASLDLRALVHHPSFVLLGLALGAGAIAVHAAMRLSGQPVSLGALASAQLGVPVAAATLGTQLHLLRPGEAAAVMLGALVTIGGAIAAGSLAVRAGLTTPPEAAPGRAGAAKPA
ncbi:cation:proton antiporter [Streptacidiphilus sp. PB12-B1b]|uniref:cation:proton antiporter n=1 Tax=Streptacidiphilus sp. PB12-B1b TaxID=2705012 RepID=UPI0015FBA9E5|nr:cation:proton antiporter [Streptacidiphilus sp. PB12-B1b]QMU76635.1 cation:proton antiporter [Streptacidiphilus sp. PB12-B1b]